MPPKIIFSRAARNDLADIADYIALDSAFYADQVIEDLVARTEILLIQPKAGRMIPEIGKEARREVFEHSWRIMYTTEFFPDIVITRIIHFAQDFRA